MKKCIKCGKELGDDFKLCPYCGEEQERTCPKCNKKVSPDFKLCPYCGESLVKKSSKGGDSLFSFSSDTSLFEKGFDKQLEDNKAKPSKKEEIFTVEEEKPKVCKKINTKKGTETSKLYKKELMVREGTTNIREAAYRSRYDLESVIIPKGVKSIGKEAFKFCTDLKNVSLPEGLETIGDTAFYNCNSLETIVLPSTLTNIGEYAFFNTKLKSIIIPPSVTQIGKMAFYNCDIETIVIPSSVKKIGENVFSAGIKTIYCEAASKLSGWHERWNASIVGDNKFPTIWGYKK